MLRVIGEKVGRVRFALDLNNRRSPCHPDRDDSVFFDDFRKCCGGRMLDHVDEVLRPLWRSIDDLGRPLVITAT